MRYLIVFVALMLPLHAVAHTENGVRQWWSFDPWVWIPMIFFTGLYLRGLHIVRAKQSPMRAARPYAIASFAAAMVSLFFALIWPLDALGSVSFAAHMAQHMLLIVVAAPLLVLAEAAAPVLIALPGFLRRVNKGLGGFHKTVHFFSQPRLAFALHGTIIWVWHAPLLFEWALRYEWVHVLEHATFLGSALLFWNALRQAGRANRNYYGAAALWVLATLIHTGMLGALITFAPRPLYPFYGGVEDAPLSLMEDQQLAGLLMWIPAGFCYLIAGLAYAAAWFNSARSYAARHNEA